MDKFKGEKRNTQRQKSVLLVKRIVARRGPDQPGNKIAILKYAEKQDGLDDANTAKPRAWPVEAAYKRFPEKYQYARCADGAPKLGVGKIDKECAAADDDNPRTNNWARNAKKNC